LTGDPTTVVVNVSAGRDVPAPYWARLRVRTVDGVPEAELRIRADIADDDAVMVGMWLQQRIDGWVDGNDGDHWWFQPDGSAVAYARPVIDAELN